MPINVFLSVGSPFAPGQEEFVASLEANLIAHGLKPRTVGRSDFTNGQPLRFVNQLMDRCAGTIVVALERVQVLNGFERKGSPRQETLTNIEIATPWNQIEAAFAYAKKLPLLVIKGDNVKGDGLLEKGHDWYVHSTQVDPNFFESKQFQGTFKNWHRDVKKKAGWFGCRN